MPTYAIRRGNPPAEAFVGNGVARNLGPGTVYYADNQDVSLTTYEGSLVPGFSVSLDGAQWFMTDAPRATLVVEPGAMGGNNGAPGQQGPIGPQGPQGEQGLQGIPGPEGQLGPEGADGTGFQWKGNYNPATTYDTGDVVFRTPADPDGFTSFIATQDGVVGVTPVNSASQWDGIVIAGPAGPQGSTGAAGTPGSPGPLGPQGPVGNAGPPGAAGPGIETISDVVRGVEDRYYKALAGTIRNQGGTTFWELDNDADSRPQNIDEVTSDGEKIIVNYGEARGARVGSVVVTPDSALRGAGISLAREATPTQTEIRLVQDKRLSDAPYWDGTAKVWVRPKGVRSPFTLSGLDFETSDYDAYRNAISGLVSAYRHSEASGATLADATGNGHTGAVVSTGQTYHAAGGLLNEPGNFAIQNSGSGSASYFSYPTTGQTSALFSVEWYGKLPSDGNVLFHDSIGGTTAGYFISKSPFGFVQVRYAANLTISTFSWSLLTDGNFHHVVLTKNGTAVKVYIDGVLIISAINGLTTALSTPWQVGHSGQGGTATTSQAVVIDEFNLYNVELTLAQVRALNYAATADGILHFEHEDAGDADPSSIVLTSIGAGLDARPVLLGETVTNTSFQVEFYDSAGDRVVAATTDMTFSVARTISQREVNPQSFTAPKYFDPGNFSAFLLERSPQNYWRLNEDAGSATVADLGAGARTGTVSATGVTLGVAGLLAGDSATAAQFDGMQGKIAFANPDIHTSFAVGCLFKRTGMGSADGGANFNQYFGTIFGWTVGATRRIMHNANTLSLQIEGGGTQMIPAAGIAPLNVTHLLVWQWTGLQQEVWLNGVKVQMVDAPTFGPINNPTFWIGSYQDPSVAGAFKGIIDEPFILTRSLSDDENTQLWACASQTVVKREASVGASISLFGLLETLAPLPDPIAPQPLPTPTPLPAGDPGAVPAFRQSMAPYRSQMLDPDCWFKKALPTDIDERNAILLDGWTHPPTAVNYPAATSDNWRRFFCTVHGYDPNTSQAQATPNRIPGASIGLAWTDISEMLYIVPANQPRRHMWDRHIGLGGPTWNAVEQRLGGIPLPADARPHGTGDRYIGWYQPSTNMMGSFYIPYSSDPATTMMEPTGAPTAGGFQLQFHYLDVGYNDSEKVFLCGAFIAYNSTAADVQNAINGATTVIAGIPRIFGPARPGSYLPACVVTGGPFNVAPITVQWPTAEPLRGVGMEVVQNSLNAGGVHFEYHNAGPIDNGIGNSIVCPSIDGVVKGVDEFTGVYHDLNDGSGFQWQSHFWPSTATRLDMFSMCPDLTEIRAATVAGTGLGHCLVMSVGQAQQAPFPFISPATSGDGANSTADGSAAPEGTRWAFPPDVDLSGVAPEMMAVARTIRDHGIVAIDKTGVGCDWGKMRATKFPDSIPPAGEDYPDWWTLYNTSANASHLYNRMLPWHKLQVIDPLASW